MFYVVIIDSMALYVSVGRKSSLCWLKYKQKNCARLGQAVSKHPQLNLHAGYESS